MKARQEKETPMPIPVINARATTNERPAKLEALGAQLDEHFDNLEQGQRWIIGLLFTILIAIMSASITILVKMP